MKEPNLIDLRFAKRLKRLRKQADITQEELAVKTKLSTTFIGLIETAKRRPSLATLRKIANALKVRIRDLLVD
jgi:transcriptional regulator with XRE-family HTH domain